MTDRNEKLILHARDLDDDGHLPAEEVPFTPAGSISSSNVQDAIEELDASIGSPPGSVPIGGIIMWSGTIATIPTDWELCDGTANAPGPDLRDKFIVGATSDDAGVAKTNLTGSLTQSGGNIAHIHTASGAAVSAHANAAVSAHLLTTNVAISAHAGVAVSAHALTTNVALSAHTGAAVSAHANAAVSAHALTTNVAIANHTTGAARTSTASTIAALLTAAHTITQPVVGNHTVTQPDNHAITQPSNHTITQPVVGDHAVTQPDAHAITQPVVGNHSVTQPDNHAITQPTIGSTSAPQPYFALAYIQRMA